MADRLKGKVALVTGGSRGIGAAIVKRLAAEGASVAFTYTKGKEPADALVKAVNSAGGRAVALQADAGDATAVKAAVDATAKQLGRLDILVNNAGIAPVGPTAELSLADFDRLYAVNVRGVFVATQAALAHLPDGGRIINIGSNVGDQVAFAGITAYASTKGAVHIFTRGLARELGPRGITVNTVQPGPIDTDMNPADGDFAEAAKKHIALGRYGKGEDVAALVAFVASEEANFITGSALTVDGGLNA
jgi:3-oxoacyl-[acyl-carrier protein] reductase